MAQYVVTGGAGFIGSNLTESLLEAGESVRVLDDFSSGRRQNLDAADDWARSGGGSFELIEGSIGDLDRVRSAVEGADFVLHQAAIPSVQRSVDDPCRTNTVNVGGTLNVLEAARQAGVKRLVFASSSSLYGENETLPKVEGMPPSPISPYGLQKLTGETYCRLYWRLYGLPTIALRYFNVFGPRQDPSSEYSAVIPRFVTAMKAQRSPTIYGDGEQTRDFTFIANVVRANLNACRAGESAYGEAFNIACGDRISLNRLVDTIGDLTGSRVRPEYGDPRPGDIKHSLAGIERAGALLSYHPEVDFREGLRRTIEAY